LTSKERENLHNRLLLSIANIEEEVDRRRQNDLIEKMYAEIVDEHKVSFRYEEREIYTDEDDLEFNKLQNGPSNKTTLTISSDSSKLSSYSRYSRMSMGIREG
jgi:hypothetical protein